MSPILQYRPADRGFLICLPREADQSDWLKTLRSLPGNLQGKERLTPAKAQLFLPDSSIMELHTVPLRWQRAYPWLSSLPPDPELLGGSLAFWVTALRLLQSLIIRGAILPTLDTDSQPWRAHWGTSFTSPSDREAFEALG